MTNPDNKNQAIAKACVTLGLAPPLTIEQAKTRYRELAKLYHPDAGLLKDAARFGEISLAYSIVENNVKSLAQASLTLARDIDEEHSRAAELLKDLHEARKQTIAAEKKQKQMAEEARVLRHHYGANRKKSRGMLVGAVLIALAAVFLGFLAGMMWSAVPPILNLKPFPADYSFEVKEQIAGEFMADNGTATPAAIAFRGPINYSLKFNEGKIALDGKNADLTMSTPTLTITGWPDTTVTSGAAAAPVL